MAGLPRSFEQKPELLADKLKDHIMFFLRFMAGDGFNIHLLQVCISINLKPHTAKLITWCTGNVEVIIQSKIKIYTPSHLQPKPGCSWTLGG